ncbi:unnamed protein product [Bursaphelenchus xylophilus]|uniref:(pine wood nematode) hypothetical protein n=1 Tax=Bursaphelenchus xylophilus TaxID=6326 RepID=A0A1I7S765_BURXY|nr:unnamed protein product [Bursaphelenchus xylophilus]CAG9084667.1 unnamed protein product [Bursaphelenchus xylophilus]
MSVKLERVVKNGPIDFVGVLVRDQQVVLADAYLNETGVLYTDVVGNVQTIGYDYDGHQLVAKFARPILSDDVKNDQQLDECTSFLLPQKPGLIPPTGIKPNLNEFNKVEICDIQEHCSISIDTKQPKAFKADAKEDVRFAKSVDISGAGDPCGFTGHDYTANWTYDKTDDKIHFVYRFPSKEGKYWSAIGIGDNMSDMDIAVMFLENGDVKKMGDYFSSGYGVPDEDSNQDWSLDSSKKVDSEVEIHFSRKVVTDDSEKDRPMDDCVLFQFGINSGHYGDGYKIRKHDGWPDLYKACNLRDNCAAIQIEKRKNKNKQHKEKNDEESETSTPVVDESNDQQETVLENDQKPKKGKNKNKNKGKGKGKGKNKKQDNEEQVDGSGQEFEGSGQEEPEPVPEHTTEVATEPETTSNSVSPSKQPEPTTLSAEATTVAQEATTQKDSLSESTTVNDNEEAATASTKIETTAEPKSDDKTTTVKDKCDHKKPDLNVCEGYMNNYLAQVKEWAERHDETIEQQYGKACALLNAVPHVPSLCCHIFQKVCANQISQ